MVHKTTEFKLDEIDGCMEALHLCEAVDLVQIVEDVGWRGIRIDGDSGTQKGKPAAFPVLRGSLVGLSPRGASMDAWGRSGSCWTWLILPGGSKHPSSNPIGAPRRPWALGRNRTGDSCTFQDGLEQ